MATDKDGHLIDILRTVAGDGGVAKHIVPRECGRNGSPRLVRAANGRVKAEDLQAVGNACSASARFLRTASERVPACPDALRRHATCHMPHVSCLMSPQGVGANPAESTAIHRGSQRHRLVESALPRSALPRALVPVRGFVTPFFASGGRCTERARGMRRPGCRQGLHRPTAGESSPSERREGFQSSHLGSC